MSTSNCGWYRLWIVFTVLIFAAAYWISAKAPLIQPAIYNQSCVPGTRVQSTDYALVREPTGSEVAAATTRIQKDFSEAGLMIDAESLDFNALNSAEMDIVRTASFEECFSAAELIENLIIALFVVLSLAPIFLIIRWIARGFASKV